MKRVIWLLALVFAFRAQAQNEYEAWHNSDAVYWNQFRGPNGQGVMAAAQIPVHFGPDTKVLWKTEIDEGQSSPVIWGDRLFVSDAARGGRGETKWDAEWSWNVLLKHYDADKDHQIHRKEMVDGFRIPLRPDLAEHEPGAAYPLGPDQAHGLLDKLDKNKDSVLTKAEWLAFMSGFVMDSQPILLAIRPGAHGDVRPLNVAWEIHSGIPEMPSPLYCQGRIYLLRNGGVLTAVKAAPANSSSANGSAQADSMLRRPLSPETNSSRPRSEAW